MESKKSKLIYFCVSVQEKYLQLVKLLLRSAIDFGSIDATDTCDVTFLMITIPDFKLKLESLQDESFDITKLKIDYFYLDLQTVDDTLISRLRIFEYPEIDKYSDILYVDTDVLIMDRIDRIFNLPITYDRVYAITEDLLIDRSMPHTDSYGGYELFSDYDLTLFPDPYGYCAGVMLFKNSHIIRKMFSDLFEEYNDYKIFGGHKPKFLDQAFLVHYTKKFNMSDQTLLSTIGANVPTDPGDFAIGHFWGVGAGPGPTRFDNKIYEMSGMMSKLYSKKNKTIKN